MKLLLVTSIFIFLVLIIFGCQSQNGDENQILENTIAKFSPTGIRYDESLLDDRQAVVIKKLYMAAKVCHEIP